jgi:hypothetical protein
VLRYERYLKKFLFTRSWIEKKRFGVADRFSPNFPDLSSNCWLQTPVCSAIPSCLSLLRFISSLPAIELHQGIARIQTFAVMTIVRHTRLSLSAGKSLAQDEDGFEPKA